MSNTFQDLLLLFCSIFKSPANGSTSKGLASPQSQTRLQAIELFQLCLQLLNWQDPAKYSFVILLRSSQGVNTQSVVRLLAAQNSGSAGCRVCSSCQTSVSNIPVTCTNHHVDPLRETDQPQCAGRWQWLPGWAESRRGTQAPTW